MKKIWLLCLCLASFSLVGCFHVPDEDWLPSNNKTESWNNPQNEDVEQAINSFIEGIDVVSTQRDQLNNEDIKNEEGDEDTGTANNEGDIINTEETTDNNETINNEESNNSEDTVDIEHIDQETEENIVSEE